LAIDLAVLAEFDSSGHALQRLHLIRDLREVAIIANLSMCLTQESSQPAVSTSLFNSLNAEST